MKPVKPLGRKAYGSIGHLPGSRMGPADHKCPDGYLRICCEKVRDKHDRIIVQEKYDGSCVAVAKINGELIPLGRAGYPCLTSKYEQYHLFHHWAMERAESFDAVLNEGEWIVGEWLAQAHGTRYNINCIFEPFIAFDVFSGGKRLCFNDFIERIVCGLAEKSVPKHPFNTPRVLGYGSMSIKRAKLLNCNPWRLDPLEGFVWRVERKGVVEFLAKWVDPQKVDGKYLPEISGKEAVWNWRPSK